MTSKQHLKLGRLTALITFLLGTAIFGCYFLTSASELLFLGYLFIVLAGLINIGVLISILIRAKEDNAVKKNSFTTSAIMLVNIPTMIFYCWISMTLLNTMRITFINETGNTVRNISVTGCGGGYIKQLEIGESKTVWIDINGDCSIYLEYMINGTHKGETVASYITSSMGHKTNHIIDGKDKDIL